MKSRKFVIWLIANSLDILRLMGREVDPHIIKFIVNCIVMIYTLVTTVHWHLDNILMLLTLAT